MTLQNELDLTFHAENHEEDIQLYIDPEKIEDVMCNLLINAVKFTPAGGKITVTLKKTPVKEADFPSGSLDTAVCDTGPGIPREQLANIFDRFYQSESTYEHHRKGSGIGLAIAKELVELHHGKIEANSREGEGTEFIIRLPMGDEHLKPDEIVGSGKESYQHKRPGELLSLNMMEEEPGVPAEVKPGAVDDERDIILVVEDSADVREYIREALEPLYRVIEAADGREGIQQAQEIIPDLIISDIMMPGTDGYELCKVLKTDVKTSHVPIVLLTAKAAEENIIEGLETGADDYITKPFNTKILLTRIKNLIDLRRHLQEKIQREMVLHPTEISVSPIDREFMKELKTAIEKSLSESEFGVDDLAKTLYISRASLNRKIRAITGESTNNFIQSYRLKKAAQLLKAKYGNITDVAFEVGFSSSAYFTKCFKEKFHQLPHTYMTSESGLS
jgi:DNA-binding response OmpR family regulator